MKTLLMIFLSATFALTLGCTKSAIGCSVQSSVSSLVSSTVASTLACKNLDSVKADVDVQLAKLKLCEAPAHMSTMGAVGDLVCGPVVELLASSLLGTIPSAWGCTGGATVSDLKLKILAACQKAL